MYVQISIIKSPGAIKDADVTRTFNAQGGYIGRGANNQWVLPDPERFLSTRHCQVSLQNGQCYLIDLSTNGTFINHSVEPLGKGNKIALKEGDVFSLGEYEFQITQCGVDSAAGSDFNRPEYDSPFAASPFAAAAGDNDVFNSPLSAGGFDPFSQGHVSTQDSLFNVEPDANDPLLALDKAREGSTGSPRYESDPFAKGASHSDGAS
jgi:type VI secretion system protein